MIRLSYPYDIPTLVVELPSPSWGDTYSIDTKVTTLETMSGDILSYRRTGNNYRLAYEFLLPTDCDPTLITRINALLLEGLGAQMKLEHIDMRDGEVWSVQCITTDPTYTSTGTRHRVSLTFEGILSD